MWRSPIPTLTRNKGFYMEAWYVIVTSQDKLLVNLNTFGQFTRHTAIPNFFFLRSLCYLRSRHRWPSPFNRSLGSCYVDVDEIYNFLTNIVKIMWWWLVIDYPCKCFDDYCNQESALRRAIMGWLEYGLCVILSIMYLKFVAISICMGQ